MQVRICIEQMRGCKREAFKISLPTSHFYRLQFKRWVIHCKLYASVMSTVRKPKRAIPFFHHKTLPFCDNTSHVHADLSLWRTLFHQALIVPVADLFLPALLLPRVALTDIRSLVSPEVQVDSSVYYELYVAAVQNL